MYQRSGWKRSFCLGVAFMALAATAEASDNLNLCANAPGEPSANVQLPRDDGFHYALDPVNLQFDDEGNVVPPASADWEFNGWESDFKSWHLKAVVNGKLTPFDGYRFFISTYDYDFQTWVKLAIFNLVGPDGQHHYAKVDFGPYDAPADRYDLIVDNWKATGTGGVEQERFLTDDGLFGVHLFDNSLKNPSYPHSDGFGEYISPTTGDKLGETYYWARPFMGSLGTLTYDGHTYPAFGTAWQDRQWRGQSYVSWNWASIQLDSGETLAAYDIVETSSGQPVLHSLDIEGKPFGCRSEKLNGVDDWELQATGAWTSPFSGYTYATDFRLLVPSKNIDLTLTPVVLNQEIVSAVNAFPGAGGAWEGAMTVQGTLNGRHVSGRAYVEQFNIQ